MVAADSALAVVDSESQPGVALEQRGGGPSWATWRKLTTVYSPLASEGKVKVPSSLERALHR